MSLHEIKQELSKHWVISLLLAGAVLARLIFPGDAPFINDEPYFLSFGLKFAETFDPMILGLPGKFGVRYGPFTSWFFGFLFLFTKNLVTMVLLKTLIVTLMTLLSCLWLARNLAFVKLEFILPVISGLYLFIDARLLWDLNIPNTVMAFAAYVAFIKHERFAALLLSVLMLAFGTLTHLMCLPIVFAIVLHFGLFKWQWIMRQWPKALVLVIVLMLIAGPYYFYVLENLLLSTRPASQAQWDIRALLYAFQGGRLFTTHDFSYFIGDNWQWVNGLPVVLNYLLSALAGITWIAYPVSWIGLFLAIKKLMQLKWWQKAVRDTSSVDDQVMIIALVTVFIHAFFSFTGELRGHPHYYNGAWPGMLIMFWLGMDFCLKKWRRFQILHYAYLTSLFIFLWKTVFFIHGYHGTKTLHYGPTLANQIEVVGQLLTIKNPQSVNIEANHPRMFPHAFGFIAHLSPRPSDVEKVTIQSARVEYVTNDPFDGAIQLKINQ